MGITATHRHAIMSMNHTAITALFVISKSLTNPLDLKMVIDAISMIQSLENEVYWDNETFNDLFHFTHSRTTINQ
jgi:hypothetical protein